MCLPKVGTFIMKDAVADVKAITFDGMGYDEWALYAKGSTRGPSEVAWSLLKLFSC